MMSCDLYSSVCSYIDNEKALLEKVSNDIWSHPELKFEEVFAHELLTSVLEEKGFSVQPKYVLPTAFRAEFSNISGSKPYIAFLCEYDALPEIGHACGHNLIAECGLAAGLAVKAALQTDPKLHGTVVVFGTPAEEGGAGKVHMIRAGAFQDIDICMMAHPSPFNRIAPITAGIRMLTATFKGKAAHASAFPWEGLNALDAAVACYNSVSMFRQQMKLTCRVHGIISKGGVAPNIIPEESEMKFFIRALSNEDLDSLEKKLLDCFHASAQATGCQVEIDNSEPGYKALVTNSVIKDVFQKHAESFGIIFHDGEMPIGSTDTGDVSQEVPTIQPCFYIDTDAGNHSKEFCLASGASEAQPYTLNIGKSLAMTAIDFLLNPELVSKAKKQFEKDFAEGM